MSGVGELWGDERWGGRALRKGVEFQGRRSVTGRVGGLGFRGERRGARRRVEVSRSGNYVGERVCKGILNFLGGEKWGGEFCFDVRGLTRDRECVGAV